MAITKVAGLFKRFLAVMLIIEGGYYLLGILSTILTKHLFYAEFRCLLILLGIFLWRNSNYSEKLTLVYLVFSLLAGIIFKLETILLIPDSINILFVLGLITPRTYSQQDINTFIAFVACFRAIELLLLFWIMNVENSEKRMVHRS